MADLNNFQNKSEANIAHPRSKPQIFLILITEFYEFFFLSPELKLCGIAKARKGTFKFAYLGYLNLKAKKSERDAHTLYLPVGS